MSYTLSPRQRALYRDKATLYKLNPGTTPAETYSPMYEHIPFLFAPTTHFDKLEGTTQPDFTSDVGSFHASQDIGDKWVVYIETGSVHSPGSWHKVVGTSRTLPVFAHSQQVFLASMMPLKGTQIIGIDEMA